jgi:hypothetical protein
LKQETLVRYPVTEGLENSLANNLTNNINLTLHGSFKEHHLPVCGLIGPTMTTTLYKIKDGYVGLICPTCITHRSIQCLGGKSGDTLHAHLEPLQVEFRRSEKSARFLRMSGFWHSKCSELECKVNQPFLTSITQILTAPSQGS